MRQIAKNMNAYFDIQAVKNWYDATTQTYQNKPSCLKVEFYQKVGTRTETRETKNFEKEDLEDLTKGENLAIACKRFTAEGGWNWLVRTIDNFIPSGVENLMVSYYTSNGAAKGHFPVSLNKKQDVSLTAFSNISGLSGTSGNQQNDFLQAIAGMLGQVKTVKTEEELREEIRKDLERDRKIEDLENYIEQVQNEKLGALNKIGAILQTSPELAAGVGSGINMLFGVLGQQLGKVINGFAQGNPAPTASVGTIESEGEDVIITIDVALAEVQKQFPNENPIITIYKLAKVLEQNAMFKPTIQSMIEKIEI